MLTSYHDCSKKPTIACRQLNHIERMSTTATRADGAVYTLQETIATYDLHLTGEDTSAERGDVAEPNSRPRSQEPSQGNPPNWPNTHRRVPDHRPINTLLDHAERPLGRRPAETMFVFTMMYGGWVQAVRQSNTTAPVRPYRLATNRYRRHVQSSGGPLEDDTSLSFSGTSSVANGRYQAVK